MYTYVYVIRDIGTDFFVCFVRNVESHLILGLHCETINLKTTYMQF